MAELHTCGVEFSTSAKLIEARKWMDIKKVFSSTQDQAYKRCIICQFAHVCNKIIADTTY
jgi:hypothetical protein